MNPVQSSSELPAGPSQYAADSVGQLRMLGDRILLKPLKWEPSKIIEVVRFGRPVRGVVMAIGPGHHPIKYKPHPDGKRRIANYSKRFRPTEVKVGDVVELGGLNIFDGKGYQFPEVVVGNETMLICTERDVAIVCEPEFTDIGLQTEYITREQALEKWPQSETNNG